MNCLESQSSKERRREDERDAEILVLRNRGLLGSHLLDVTGMKVYTANELMELLHVGKPTALAIMKSHGFQIGYTKLSPYRITEEQLAKYAEDMKNERGNTYESVRSK